jgi:tripartite-type tricarboxylate transporter receptor subunit TctC
MILQSRLAHRLTLRLGILAHVCLLGAGAALSAHSALAQEPGALAGKKLRLVVPFSPGGSVDGLARTVADGLQKTGGASVIVENRPGAGGNIAANMVAKSSGDTTHLLVTSINFYVNPVIVRNSGYDAFKDFAPIAHLGSMPYVFVVPPDSSIGSLKDVVAQARANPGKLSWGFGGNGTLGHFLGMALEDASGMKGNPVAYRGGPDLLTALGGKHIDMVIMTVQSAAPLVKQGRLKAIAMSEPERNKVLPSVPTAHEQVPGYPRLNGYVFMLAAVGTPEPLLAAIQRETNRVLRSEAFVQRMSGDGASVREFASPAEAKAFFDADGVAWEALTRKAGLKVE